MLEELVIKDFAIIERTVIEFEKGLTLFTGETGAGKSILIGALGFILGAKAETGCIRSGTEETSVTGIFSISGNIDAQQWLLSHDIAYDDEKAVLRRILKTNGRGACYINDIPVTRQNLEAFAQTLVEIHGQRDGMGLLKQERQRQVLDRYAGLEDTLQCYSGAYTELCSLQRQLEIIEHDDAQEEREIELLTFAIKEISEAGITPNEEILLQEEENRLSQYEKLYGSISSLHELFSEHDGIIAKLRKANATLEHIAALDPKISAITESVTNSYYELEDAAGNISAYLDKLSFDPDRLEKIEERLALLQKLKRKYGKTLEDVINYKEEAERKLEAFTHRGDDIEILKKKISEKERIVYDLADELSKKRHAAKNELENKINAILHTLGMPHAAFFIKMGKKPLENGKIVVGPFGYDEPEFLISANKGEPQKPLSLVVSGGELARIMLAIKTILAMADDIPTLVFDEVDTGIGGEVALSVGKHLHDLASQKQVLCITHLAVIAAKADHHFKVEKYIEKERTLTRLQKMTRDARIKEIARMLAGDTAGEAALQHARALLEE